MKKYILVSCLIWTFHISSLFAADTPCGNQLPGGATAPGGCPPSTAGANPFHVYTGNVTRSSLDLEVWGSVGENKLAWKRQNNSRMGSLRQNVFGQGANWRHPYQWAVADAGGSVGARRIQIDEPLGGSYTFLEQGTNSNLWLPAANVGKRVVQQGNDYTLIRNDGGRFHFRKTGTGSYLPLTQEDSQGNITTFAFDQNEQLTRITEPAGRYLQLSYQQITLDQRTTVNLGAVNPGGDVYEWKTYTLATPVERRYATYEGETNSYCRVAEIEYYDENNVRLTGTPISSTAAEGYSAASAFDGDPTTFYRSQNPTYGYVGLDFGSVKKIKTVRVMLDYNSSTSPGGVLYAFDSAPVPVTVLAGITSGDGRSVSYQYEQIADSNPDVLFKYLVLKKAVYGDGTEAVYTYTQLYPMTTPLLQTAVEPRAAQDSTQIQYTYKLGKAPLGMIDEEIDLPTGDVLASLGATSEHTPFATYANGRVQKFTFSFSNANVSDYTDGRGNKTTYTFGKGGSGFLLSQKDSLGRSTTYGSRDALGQPLSTTYPDATLETYTRDDLGLPLTRPYPAFLFPPAPPPGPGTAATESLASIILMAVSRPLPITHSAKSPQSAVVMARCKPWFTAPPVCS